MSFDSTVVPFLLPTPVPSDYEVNAAVLLVCQNGIQGNFTGAGGQYRITPVGNLLGLSNMTGTGFATCTYVDNYTVTFASRNFTNIDGTINIENGDGIANDPIFSVVNDTNIQRVNCLLNGVSVSTRANINFIDTDSNVFTVTDNPGDNEVDISFLASVPSLNSYFLMRQDDDALPNSQSLESLGTSGASILKNTSSNDVFSLALATPDVDYLSPSDNLLALSDLSLGVAGVMVVTASELFVTGIGTAGQVFVVDDAGTSFTWRTLSIGGTVTSVGLTSASSGLTVGGATPITVSGAWTLTLDADLQALSQLSSTGFVIRSAANTYVQRSIASGTGITVSNGDGILGNPTIAITNVGTAGTYAYPTSVTTNAQGQVSSITAGSTPPVTSVSGTASNITSSGGTTPIINLATAGTAGTYTNPTSVTTDTFGRVTAIVGGGTPGSVTSVGLSSSSAGLTVTGATPIITTGAWALSLDADLEALSELNGEGFIVRIGVSEFEERTLVAGTGISISSNDGVAGNPSFSITATGVTANTYAYPSSVIVNAGGQITGITAGSTPTLGTVTSLGLTGSTGLTVGGATSPVTSSGTYTLTLSAPLVGVSSATGQATGYILSSVDGSNTLAWIPNTIGTVTSLGLTGGTGITVGGTTSPITTSGTYTLTLAAPLLSLIAATGEASGYIMSSTNGGGTWAWIPNTTGTVTASGTPLVNQLAVWTTATNAKGITVGGANTLLMGNAAADPSWLAAVSDGQVLTGPGILSANLGYQYANTKYGLAYLTNSGFPATTSGLGYVEYTIGTNLRTLLRTAYAGSQALIIDNPGINLALSLLTITSPVSSIDFYIGTDLVTTNANPTTLYVGTDIGATPLSVAFPPISRSVSSLINASNTTLRLYVNLASAGVTGIAAFMTYASTLRVSLGKLDA